MEDPGLILGDLYVPMIMPLVIGLGLLTAERLRGVRLGRQMLLTAALGSVLACPAYIWLHVSILHHRTPVGAGGGAVVRDGRRVDLLWLLHVGVFLLVPVVSSAADRIQARVRGYFSHAG
ncbi:hypothetical protein HY251_15925 [bacterium]|nr:hypothetical protein [bacterium]